MFSINQGENEDESQSDPHPETGLFTSGLEDRHDMVTGATERRDMAIGAQRERVHRRTTW